MKQATVATLILILAVTLPTTWFLWPKIFPSEEERLFQRAQQGDPAAQYEWALLLRDYDGPIPVSEPGRSVEWLDRAAAQMHRPALDLRIAEIRNEEDADARRRALAWLEHRAVLSDPELGYLRLVLLQESGAGAGVIRSAAEGAAEAGSAEAQWILASLEFESGNTQAGWRWTQRAARGGVGPAQLHLARAYEAGNHFAQDAATAEEWYFAASKQGIPYAQWKTAVAYMRNLRNPGFRRNARELLDSARASGLVEAEFSLADFYRQTGDHALAGATYRSAAERGYAPAIHALLWYRDRPWAVPMDRFEVGAWALLLEGMHPWEFRYPPPEPVSGIGHTRVLWLARRMQLGWREEDGPDSIALPDDPQLLEALRNHTYESRFGDDADLLRDAFDGDVESLFAIGNLIASRTIPGSDPEEARAWLEEAALRGSIPAMTRLWEFVVGDGTPILHPDLYQSAKRWMETAARSDADAAYRLARHQIESFPGESPPWSDITRNLRTAVRLGHPSAAGILDLMILDGNARFPADESDQLLDNLRRLARARYPTAEYQYARALLALLDGELEISRDFLVGGSPDSSVSLAAAHLGVANRSSRMIMAEANSEEALDQALREAILAERSRVEELRKQDWPGHVIMECLESAANHGYPEAVLLYSRLSRMRFQSEDRSETAYRLLLPLADAGDDRALFELSHYYFSDSLGQPMDRMHCVMLIRQAAEAGHQRARARFSDLMPEAERDPDGWASPEEIYYLAEASRDPLAMMELADRYRKARDHDSALQWIQQAAQEGHLPAFTAAARIYDDGIGIRRDPLRAIRWYEAAAAQGDQEAQYHLGMIYASGKYVVRDEPRAVQYLQEAAAQGYRLAEEALQSMGVLADLTGAASPAERVSLMIESGAYSGDLAPAVAMGVRDGELLPITSVRRGRPMVEVGTRAVALENQTPFLFAGSSFAVGSIAVAEFMYIRPLMNIDGILIFTGISPRVVVELTADRDMPNCYALVIARGRGDAQLVHWHHIGRIRAGRARTITMAMDEEKGFVPQVVGIYFFSQGEEIMSDQRFSWHWFDRPRQLRFIEARNTFLTEQERSPETRPPAPVESEDGDDSEPGIWIPGTRSGIPPVAIEIAINAWGSVAGVRCERPLPQHKLEAILRKVFERDYLPAVESGRAVDGIVPETVHFY